MPLRAPLFPATAFSPPPACRQPRVFPCVCVVSSDSSPPQATDRIYCKILAHNSVHAAFAGYTGTTVGLMNTHYVFLPIPTVIQAPRRVDPHGKMWNRLRNSIGMPDFTDSPNSCDLPPARA